MVLKRQFATLVAIAIALLHFSPLVEATSRDVFLPRSLEAAPGVDRQAVAARLIVELRSGNDFPAATPAIAARWFRQRLGIAVDDWRPAGGESYVLELPAGTDVEAMARGIAARPEVEYAEPDYIYQASVIPNDAFYTRQYALPRIAAPQAWDRTTGNPNLVIAVVDTGVYAGHPDFGSNVVGGTDFVNDDGDASDDQGHGTHTAGIIAAVGNNGRGVAGVCWQCKILPVKALNEQGAGSASDVALAVRYAADRGAKVINLSLGGENNSQTLHNAIIYAAGRGALIVVAAGNSAEAGNPVEYPAAYEEVLAVAATDQSDRHASFSNYGSHIDVAAPGVDIGSTLWARGSSEVYGAATGTSEAAPFVAGLAGLIWAVNPSLSRDEVRNLILSTADDLGTPGHDVYFGAGRIHAQRAVSAAVPPPPPLTAPPPPSNEPLAFPETGYSVRGEFRRFWEANGGLPVFGFPISEERVETTPDGAFLVQYFQRNRFELHPENKPPYNVLLGRLGDTILRQSNVDWSLLPKGQPQSGCLFFDETGHSICEPFLSHWRAHGLRDPQLDAFGRSLGLFGMPLSEPTIETNSSGDTVVTQWFERARFEDHRRGDGGAGILLGLLGAELGKLPAAPVTPPGDVPDVPATPPPPPAVVSPCPQTPVSVHGRAGPDPCLALGVEMEIDVFGFHPGEQISFWLTSPTDQVFGDAHTITAGGDGSMSGLRFPTAGLTPGRWFWVFQGQQSGHQSIVFYHLYSP